MSKKAQQGSEQHSPALCCRLWDNDPHCTPTIFTQAPFKHWLFSWWPPVFELERLPFNFAIIRGQFGTEGLIIRCPQSLLQYSCGDSCTALWVWHMSWTEMDYFRQKLSRNSDNPAMWKRCCKDIILVQPVKNPVVRYAVCIFMFSVSSLQHSGMQAFLWTHTLSVCEV